ncbi:NupC/NupG family nucleoside CNT transporter [candidate division KSB1 bacterium]|nr:NupC/NupG family nucleoside CNT transporter [candidate division KSB1 bacterium]
MERLLSLLGIPVLILLAWLILSTDRRHFPWRVVLWGVGLQFTFAFLILWTPWGRSGFAWLGDVVTKFLSYSNEGAAFMFGNLVKQEYQQTFGFQFAFAILPTIIFVGAVTSIGYHLGVLQRIVKGVAWLMAKTMGTSGAESLSTAVNIFVGQTEAPLVIRPFLNRLTMSELNAVMVGGFAGIAGGVMAGYILLGVPAKHLLAACVMCAPASFVFAKIAIPERDKPLTAGQVQMPEIPPASNVIDAAGAGARDGLLLAANVGAMLIAFIGLIALINALLSWTSGHLFDWGFLWFPDSLRTIFSVVFVPVGVIVGVPWHECRDFAYLIGTQISINEFVAYIELSKLIESGALSERTITLASYALCGFCNSSSVAIQIGGISALVPERRHDLAKLGLRAMFCGAFACWQTATIAGVLTS